MPVKCSNLTFKQMLKALWGLRFSRQ